MKAGHLYLTDTSLDLTTKSGIYSLFEHYQNINGVQEKNNPTSSIYEDFKTYNLNKYNYIKTNNLQVLDSTAANVSVAGVFENTIEKQYIQFNIQPLQHSNLSFYLYTPNQENIDYILDNCYNLNINNQDLDLKSYYIDNPQSFNFAFSHILYPLEKDIFYTIRFEFNSNIYYCIDEQALAITEIIFPYIEQ